MTFISGPVIFASAKPSEVTMTTAYKTTRTMNDSLIFSYGRLACMFVNKIAAAIISCASLAVLFGCDTEIPLKQESVRSRDFLIRAGEHYSTPRLMETTDKNTLEFSATFDKSAIYDLGDASLQTNINKLMGFSDCSTHHHENSARFGWAWNNDRLEIYAYCYIDGVRKSQLAGIVNIDEENRYKIAADENEYLFFINGEQRAAIQRASSCEAGTNYRLYPYFGGSAPAPHDMTVKVEIIE